MTIVLLLTLLWACDTGSSPTDIEEHRFVDWTLVDTSQWHVNVHDYEHLMTLTAVLTLDGDTLNRAENKVAAFSGNSIRSNAVSYSHLGRQLYAMNLYSNDLGDSLNFAVWIEELKRSVMVENVLLFVSNSALGDPDNPYELLIK